MQITQSGVGSTTHNIAIRDSNGIGLLPVQTEITNGTATYRVLGRCAPNAPWRELKAAATAGFLESMAMVPYLQLEIISGTGTVSLWVHEG